MHTPLHQLAQQQHLNSGQTQALWQLAGLHAPPSDVHYRLRQARALVAALLLGAGLIFWVAANWDVQSRLFKLHLLQAAAVVPLAVVGQAERYEVRARFSTWLFTLAHNRMIDYCRTRKDHASLDAPDDSGLTLADTLVAPSGYGPLRQIETREQAQQLLAALDALPLPQREAFVLQGEAGLSVAEIAQVTGVGLQTAKSRLRYARAALCQQLEGMA